MKKHCFKKYNYKYCVDSRFPDGVLIDAKPIGEGVYGVAYSGKWNSQKIVVKFQLLDVPIPGAFCFEEYYIYGDLDCPTVTTQKFKKEVENIQLLASLGIGPKVLYEDIYNAIDYAPNSMIEAELPIPKHIGVVIMEHAGISLDNLDEGFFMKHHTELLNNYLKLMKKLYDNGMINVDNHFGNITVDVKTMRMQLIDPQLETIKQYGQYKTWPDIRNKLYKYEWDTNKP
jgi:hypothetical protein